MNENQTQQRIARWLGWTQDAISRVWWYAPGDWSDEPNDRRPRRLPNLNTDEGAALWEKLIEAEFTRRGWWVSSFTWENGSVDFAVYRGPDKLAEKNGATKLAALTAAVLAILESEK